MRRQLVAPSRRERRLRRGRKSNGRGVSSRSYRLSAVHVIVSAATALLLVVLLSARWKEGIPPAPFVAPAPPNGARRDAEGTAAVERTSGTVEGSNASSSSGGESGHDAPSTAFAAAAAVGGGASLKPGLTGGFGIDFGDKGDGETNRAEADQLLVGDSRREDGTTVRARVELTTEELHQIVEREFGPWRLLPSTERAAGGEGGEGEVRGQEESLAKSPSSCAKKLQYGIQSYPEKDLADCYRKQSAAYEFGEPLTQLDVTVKGGGRPVKRDPRGVIVFMSTSSASDIKNLQGALGSLTQTLLNRHKYPVAVVHEDFSTELMETLSSHVPVPVYFVKVQFKLPYWLEPLKDIVPLMTKHYTGHPSSRPLKGFHTHLHGLVPYNKRGTFGYYHMCRFFAGAGYMLPFFDDYDWYIRLDSDSRCDGKSFDTEGGGGGGGVGGTAQQGDIIGQMVQQGKLYAYNRQFLDSADVVEGLWNFAHSYLRRGFHGNTGGASGSGGGSGSRRSGTEGGQQQEGDAIHPSFLFKPRDGGGGGGGIHTPFSALKDAWSKPVYPRCADQSKNKASGRRSAGADSAVSVSVLPDGTEAHLLDCEDNSFHPVPSFYTNFEVASLAFLRGREYQHWFNAVDRQGQIFYHRWGDAPLRFLGLSIHMPADKIISVKGCFHK